MKKKIEKMLYDIETKMANIESVSLYWLTDEWRILHAKREVLGEILKLWK